MKYIKFAKPVEFSNSKTLPSVTLRDEDDFSFDNNGFTFYTIGVLLDHDDRDETVFVPYSNIVSVVTTS